MQRPCCCNCCSSNMNTSVNFYTGVEAKDIHKVSVKPINLPEEIKPRLRPILRIEYNSGDCNERVCSRNCARLGIVFHCGKQSVFGCHAAFVPAITCISARAPGSSSRVPSGSVTKYHKCALYGKAATTIFMQNVSSSTEAVH